MNFIATLTVIFCWDYPGKLLMDKSDAFYCTFEFDLTHLFKCYFETDLVFGSNQIYWKELNIFVWPKPLLKQQVMVNTTKQKKYVQFFPTLEKGLFLSVMFMVLPPEANPNHKVRPTLKTGSMLNEDTHKTWFSRVVLELLESRLASADNSMEGHEEETGFVGLLRHWVEEMRWTACEVHSYCSDSSREHW